MRALTIFSVLCALAVGCSRDASTETREAQQKPWDGKAAHRAALPPKAQGEIPTPPAAGHD